MFFFFYGISSTGFVILLRLKQDLKHMAMIFMNKNDLIFKQCSISHLPTAFSSFIAKSAAKIIDRNIIMSVKNIIGVRKMLS